jgi:hypothetical protein
MHCSVHPSLKSNSESSRFMCGNNSKLVSWILIPLIPHSKTANDSYRRIFNLKEVDKDSIFSSKALFVRGKNNPQYSMASVMNICHLFSVGTHVQIPKEWYMYIYIYVFHIYVHMYLYVYNCMFLRYMFLWFAYIWFKCVPQRFMCWKLSPQIAMLVIRLQRISPPQEGLILFSQSEIL